MSCIFYISCDTFIPLVIRSMSKGRDQKRRGPDLKSKAAGAQPSLGFSCRFWHHAVLCGPSLHPCLHPLGCGGHSAAGENGEESNGG